MKVLLVISWLLAQTPAAVPAGLLGIWELDSMRGAVPVGVRNVRALCGGTAPTVAELPDGAAHESSEADARQMTPLGSFDATLTIAMADQTVTVTRKYSGVFGDASFSRTYPLDGSAASVSGATLRTNTVFAPAAPATTPPCAVSEVFEIDGNGSLRITASATEGAVRTSVQTYVRKSKALHFIPEDIR